MCACMHPSVLYVVLLLCVSMCICVCHGCMFNGVVNFAS